MSRCDIALLQEVKDRKGKAVPLLLEALNRYSITPSTATHKQRPRGATRHTRCSINQLQWKKNTQTTLCSGSFVYELKTRPETRTETRTVVVKCELIYGNNDAQIASLYLGQVLVFRHIDVNSVRFK